MPARKSHERLVNERRRVERARPAFAPQMAGGHLLQFLVDKRNDNAERLLVAGMYAPQQLRNLHGPTELTLVAANLNSAQTVPRMLPRAVSALRANSLDEFRR